MASPSFCWYRKWYLCFKVLWYSLGILGIIILKGLPATRTFWSLLYKAKFICKGINVMWWPSWGGLKKNREWPCHEDICGGNLGTTLEMLLEWLSHTWISVGASKLRSLMAASRSLPSPNFSKSLSKLLSVRCLEWLKASLRSLTAAQATNLLGDLSCRSLLLDGNSRLGRPSEALQGCNRCCLPHTQGCKSRIAAVRQIWCHFISISCWPVGNYSDLCLVWQWVRRETSGRERVALMADVRDIVYPIITGYIYSTLLQIFNIYVKCSGASSCAYYMSRLTCEWSNDQRRVMQFRQ